MWNIYTIALFTIYKRSWKRKSKDKLLVTSEEKHRKYSIYNVLFSGREHNTYKMIKNYLFEETIRSQKSYQKKQRIKKMQS